MAVEGRQVDNGSNGNAHASEIPADLLAKLDEVALANRLGQTGAHEGVW